MAIMNTSHIRFSTDGAIATIEMDNIPKHNALAAEDIDAFVAALDCAGNDPALRVLLLRGRGEKTFCAGASLQQLSSGEMDGRRFEQLTAKLASLPLPTIAVLNGSAYGGGAELGLCCDFRLGVRGMTLMVPAARFGLCYHASGIQRYVERLGVNTAKRILVASETLDDQALLDLGYLSRLVDSSEELDSAAADQARAIAELGPLAVRAMKQLCDQAAAGALIGAEAQQQIDHCNQSQDLKEGLSARAEKRKPVFSGH